MTTLTPYESALVEKVARAMHETAPTGEAFGALGPKEAGGMRDDAAHILRAIGLLGPSRAHWLAPWEATEGMAAAWESNAEGLRSPDARDDFAAMRDAHLKEGTAA